MMEEKVGPAAEAPGRLWEQSESSTSFEAAVDSLSDLLTDEGDLDGNQGQNEPQDPDQADAESGPAQESESNDGAEEPLFEIDGEEVTLTQLQEWRKDGLRQADYTRKTQQAAELRKQAEAQLSETMAMRQDYYQRLEMVKQALEMGAPAARGAAEWDSLRQQDPARFAAEWADLQRHQQEVAAVQSEQARVAQEAQVFYEAQMREHLELERQRLYQAIPEWSNEEVAKRERTSLREFAQGRYGFSDEELDGVYDHRLMLLLRDAAQYNRLATEAKPKVDQKREAVKVLQPGVRVKNANEPSRQKMIREKSRKLANSGSLDDAAELFMDLLG